MKDGKTNMPKVVVFGGQGIFCGAFLNHFPEIDYRPGEAILFLNLMISNQA
jgi:hypothetical protein